MLEKTQRGEPASVGVMGVEARYEATLAGVPGVETRFTDRRGKLLASRIDSGNP